MLNLKNCVFRIEKSAIFAVSNKLSNLKTLKLWV